MTKNVLFISIWNGGFEVVTKAKFNSETKEVFDIESYDGDLVDNDGYELEFFEGQFIELENGKRLRVVEDDEGDYDYIVLD